MKADAAKGSLGGKGRSRSEEPQRRRGSSSDLVRVDSGLAAVQSAAGAAESSARLESFRVDSGPAAVQPAAGAAGTLDWFGCNRRGEYGSGTLEELWRPRKQLTFFNCHRDAEEIHYDPISGAPVCISDNDAGDSDSMGSSSPVASQSIETLRKAHEGVSLQVVRTQSLSRWKDMEREHLRRARLHRC